MTLSTTPPLLDPGLNLAAQQAQILGLITGGTIPPTQALRGGDLRVSVREDVGPGLAPVSETLAGLEDDLTAEIAGVVPPEADPRVLLFAPGASKTDPLYALRFVAKLALATGRPGEVKAFDLYDEPNIRRYYAGLPWGRHRVHVEFGRTGNFERLRGADAHMILAIHPSTLFDTLFGLFADNLVRGGLGLVQASVLEEFREAEDYQLFLDMVLAPYRDTLEFARPPVRERIFRSYFSERSRDVHLLMVRRK
jgi:hypothetical protein